MDAKPGQKKKAGSTHRSTDAGEKDRLIIELTDRITVLENELRLKRDHATPMDIPELKRAEEALKLTGYSLDNARDVVIWFCPDGRINYANFAACRMFGYSQDEMLSLTIFDLNPRYTRESWDDRWQKLKREGSTLYEVENRAKDGHWFPIEATNTYIKYGDREFMFGYARDISERKLAEKALAFERSQLLSIFDSIDDLVYVTDPYTFEVLYANKAMKERFGCNLVGGVCYREFQRRDSPCDFCTNPIILKAKDKPYRWEFYNPTVDRYFLITDRIIRWPDGRDVRFEIAKDITERRRAEEALGESEEKFRVLAESSSAMFWLYQGERFIYVNGAGERLTGYTIDELLKMRFWDVVHHDDRDLVRDRGLARQRGEPVPKKYEVKLLTKGGETRWAELTAGRIMYRGEPAGIATFFDITERKLAEEELKEAKAQAELYLDLMGHDINNMHQIALGYLEMAQDMHPEVGDDEFLDKPVEVLQRSTQLIRNVRKLQKLSDGACQTQDVDVCTVLADVTREFGAVPRKAVTLNLNGCEHCHVRANELLQDLFANLVSNAIKHTGDRTNIDIGLDVIDDNGRQYCRVIVEDNGPGIPDDFKKKIFSRMLKGTGKAKGMGLGLYLVRSLVDSYGGKVWVEDRVPGDHMKGAKFVVILPAIDK